MPVDALVPIKGASDYIIFMNFNFSLHIHSI